MARKIIISFIFAYIVAIFFIYIATTISCGMMCYVNIYGLIAFCITNVANIILFLLILRSKNKSWMSYILLFSIFLSILIPQIYDKISTYFAYHTLNGDKSLIYIYNPFIHKTLSDLLNFVQPSVTLFFLLIIYFKIKNSSSDESMQLQSGVI